MVTYTKLVFKDKNQNRTIFLKNAVKKEMLNTVFIIGLEVNSDGDSIIDSGDRTRIIESNLIVKEVPMVMNNFYAMLEERKA